MPTKSLILKLRLVVAPNLASSFSACFGYVWRSLSTILCEWEGALVWSFPKISIPLQFSARAPLVSGPSFFLFTPRVVFWSGAISAAALGSTQVLSHSLEPERGMFCRKASSFKQITLCPTCNNHQRSCKGPVYLTTQTAGKRLLHQVT